MTTEQEIEDIWSEVENLAGRCDDAVRTEAALFAVITAMVRSLDRLHPGFRGDVVSLLTDRAERLEAKAPVFEDAQHREWIEEEVEVLSELTTRIDLDMD